ncbi:hypothetical protein roselon_01698 [Roseibacterium elongatum DSM 19469]|uniref:Uncharacterized protein n=1 Tax=Roseicyclus elongatus DSM 19469 TaxID=1294273 RepID=W8SNG5_9RHOB|nr:hypothetical protein roselon_01698 [Roseibacterium elongatum DSM 19469]
MRLSLWWHVAAYWRGRVQKSWGKCMFSRRRTALQLSHSCRAVTRAAENALTFGQGYHDSGDR